MTDGLIDFHHHARPAAFFDALAQCGRSTMGGRPFPPGWTVDGALALMDRMRIATALLSAPDADLLYRDRSIALRLSRLMNELFAGAIAERPHRFGAFASLPMPHLDDALHETVHALDELKLDGVMLSTSYDGHYLGSPEFDALLALLDHRQCVVFVHPVSPIGMSQLALDFPASLLEYAFDTTRCIANLLRHKVPARFPHIKFVFAHAGGTAPYLVSRLSLMEFFLTPGHEMRVEDDRADIVRGLRSFYYDIALSSNDAVLTLLNQVVGMDRVVFGSDYPQVPNSYIQSTADNLFQSQVIDDRRRHQVVRGNGVTLLPRLAGARLAADTDKAR
jgi:predicted TIM-barrel fold metal-dependent hydrolase